MAFENASIVSTYEIRMVLNYLRGDRTVTSQEALSVMKNLKSCKDINGRRLATSKDFLNWLRQNQNEQLKALKLEDKTMEEIYFNVSVWIEDNKLIS